MQISSNLCTDLQQQIIVLLSEYSVKEHNFQICYGIQ